MRRSVLWTVGACALCLFVFSRPSLAEPKQAPKSVSAVFSALRAMQGFEARFTEEKHLALLKAPLKSSGKLYYSSPGRLVRVVEAPEKMTISVAAGVVTIKDSEGTRRMDLKSRPGVAAFVEAFAHFLDGNEEELKKHFRLNYEVADRGFALELTPREAPLNKVVQAITLTGESGVIAEMTVTETNGDRTVTRLSQVDTKRKFSAAEKKRIFGQ